MKEPEMYGPRFESALAYAATLHHGQWRKGRRAPYIVHPLAVASLVGTYGGDEDQAIAALLHDAMEDCGITKKALLDRYGSRVADIVDAATDSYVNPKPPWRERKEAHIAKVRELPGATKLVICADKLHNAQTILQDLRQGLDVWRLFSAPKDEVRWYYRAMAAALGHDWRHSLHHEFLQSVERLHSDDTQEKVR